MQVDGSAAGPEKSELTEAATPIFAAIGRAVLAALSLESVILVELLVREAEGKGDLSEDLAPKIDKLRRLPFGARLDRLERAGFDRDLVERARDVVARRNALVHHFLELPGVAKATTSGEGLDDLLEWITQLVDDCNVLAAEIGISAFARAERVLGISMTDLSTRMANRDLDEIKSDELRAQFQMVRDVPSDFFDY